LKEEVHQQDIARRPVMDRLRRVENSNCVCQMRKSGERGATGYGKAAAVMADRDRRLDRGI
jgi:hypothetical protein